MSKDITNKVLLDAIISSFDNIEHRFDQAHAERSDIKQRLSTGETKIDDMDEHLHAVSHMASNHEDRPGVQERK